MRLLIIGALEGQLSEATKLAMQGGAKVQHASSIDIAMSALRAGRGADLLFVDVMVDIPGLIAALDGERIHIPVVACGTETNAAAAVNAIRAGAKEYIPLPPDAELIAAVIAAVARESTDFLFRDPAMARVVQLAEQIAPSDASVLVTGESGTGKEVMAKHLHSKSKRAARAFISVNCAAIPENLLESELFGHEKGAFTGAVARRIGKFEEASGGTLLLDEISEMDVRLQAKLLRAIQERVIDRVGGTRPVPVDIRIIATSNRNLQDAVRQGAFREDLLFRLNVVNLKLPPLRERPGDIAALADHFVAKYAKANGLPPRRLTDDARTALLRAPWPGNVRELENTLHRAAVAGRRHRPRGDRHARRRRPDQLGRCRQRRHAGRAGRRNHLALNGRPHRRRCRTRSHSRNPRPRSGQPHPRRQHPRHLDPHPAQQAQSIRRRRHPGARPRRSAKVRLI